MSRLGVTALFFLILAASFGAAWLGGLSRHRWMPEAAFWAVLMGLGILAAALGIDLGTD